MKKTKNCTAILLGAGKGQRVGKKENKIFIELLGKTLLQRATENILSFSRVNDVIFVFQEKEIQKAKKIISNFWRWDIPWTIIKGGKERWESSVQGVLAYTNQAKKDSYFFLHDLARPFVSKQLIEALYQGSKKKKVAAPYLPIKNTIRQKNKKKSFKKEELFSAQTPQFFHYQLTKSFQKKKPNSPSDDIYFAEQANYEVAWILGEEENIKITTPFDLELAKFLIKKNEI